MYDIYMILYRFHIDVMLIHKGTSCAVAIVSPYVSCLIARSCAVNVAHEWHSDLKQLPVKSYEQYMGENND